MCRWVAYLGQEPCLLEDVLLVPDHGLFKQVHEHFLPGLIHKNADASEVEKQQKESDLRNKMFNIDGVGVAWYTDTLLNYDASVTSQRPALYKTDRPPLNDLNLKSLIAHTSTTCLMSHIRMAESIVQSSNSHPFTFGKYTMMHNGGLGSFSQTHRLLLPHLSKTAFCHIKGSTDSECFFGLFMSALFKEEREKGGDDEEEKSYWNSTKTIEQMKTALREVLALVVSVKEEIKGEASSLNVAITDGDKTVTMRYRDDDNTQPPSLYYSTKAGVRLNRKFEGHPNNTDENQRGQEYGHKAANMHAPHLIVGSEPMTYDHSEWFLIPRNSFVWAQRNGDMKVTVEEV